MHQHLSSANGEGSRPNSLNLFLADFNQKVLELATIPNVLLTAYSSKKWSSANNQDRLDHDIDRTFLEKTQGRLHSNSVKISAISGSWTTTFCDLVPLPPNHNHENEDLLVLASETIYSPSTIPSFTRVLLDLLRRTSRHRPTTGDVSGGGGGKTRARALVAAKRVYFGVGGGVDEFLTVLGHLGGEATVVWETESAAGVGRVILEVVVALE